MSSILTQAMLPGKQHDQYNGDYQDIAVQLGPPPGTKSSGCNQFVTTNFAEICYNHA